MSLAISRPPRKVNPGHTPTDQAKMIVIEAIRRAHDNAVDYIQGEPTEVYVMATRKVLAKLHNQMLDDSGFDGLTIREQI